MSEYDLEKHLQQFKSMFEIPRLYLSNYFTDLKTEVDIYFTQNEMNETNLEEKEKLKTSYQEIINKIVEFETECFKACKTNSLNKTITMDVNLSIKNIESKMDEAKKELLIKEIFRDSIENLEYRIQEIVFLNKTMLFLTSDSKAKPAKLLIVDMIMAKELVSLLRNDYKKLDTTTAVSEIETNTYQVTSDTVIYEFIRNHLVREKSQNITEITERKIDNFYDEENCWLSYNVDGIKSAAFENFTNLTLLELSYNNLKTIESYAFEGSTQLVIINLRRNEIEYIEEDAFNDLISLEELVLSRNQLYVINDFTFIGLTNLKELNLSENSISAIDPEAFEPLANLERLNLSINRLESIDQKTFIGLKKLITLNLRGNQISTIEPDTFSDLPSLEWLDIAHNKITSIHGNSFSKLKQLQHLNLSYNSIETISRSMFSGLFRLEDLNFECSKLKSIEPNSFDKLFSLNSLRLSNNQICSLDKFLFKDLLNLKSLYLATNCLSSLDLNLFDGLKLDTLDLSNNRLSSFDNAKLEQALKNVNKIEF